jgi:hypothetical protein
MKLVAGLIVFISGLSFSASGQASSITLKDGEARVRRNYYPQKKSDAHSYRIALVKGKTIELSLEANTVVLVNGNECSLYLMLAYGSGPDVYVGDDPVGINAWTGTVERTGNHTVKVFMSCVEAYSSADLLAKKPKFYYSLRVSAR